MQKQVCCVKHSPSAHTNHCIIKHSGYGFHQTKSHRYSLGRDCGTVHHTHGIGNMLIALAFSWVSNTHNSNKCSLYAPKAADKTESDSSQSISFWVQTITTYGSCNMMLFCSNLEFIQAGFSIIWLLPHSRCLLVFASILQKLRVEFLLKSEVWRYHIK